MIKKSLLIFMIFILASGCSSNHDNRRREKYTIEYSDIEYIGHIKSLNKVTYTIDNDTEILVKNGQYVDADTKLFSKYDDEAEYEVKKARANISDLTSDIEHLNNLINKEKSKEIYDDSTINDLNDSVREKQRTIREINLELEQKKVFKEEKSTFSGQVIYKENNISLYSDTYQVVVVLKQNQINDFSNDETYELTMNDRNIGEAKFECILPSEENSLESSLSKYEAVFNIESDYKFNRDMVVTIVRKSNEIVIPSIYVKTDNKKHYVLRNGKQIEIDVKKNIGDNFILKSGLNEGDIIESFGEQSD